MSASHEKSPTETYPPTAPKAAEAAVTFSFCVWVPVCATLACWQVSNATRRVLGLNQNGPCQVDLVLRWGWFGQRQTLPVRVTKVFSDHPPLLRWSREIPSWNAQSGMKTRKLCQVRSWKSSGATPLLPNASLGQQRVRSARPGDETHPILADTLFEAGVLRETSPPCKQGLPPDP